MYYFIHIFNISSIKYWFLGVFLFVVIHAHSQNNSIITEIDSLLDKAWEHHTSIQLIPSLENALEALELANKHKYDKGRGEAHFMAADALINIGLLKEGLKHLDDIQQTEYYKKRPIVQSEIYRLKTKSYLKLKLYQLALREYQQQQKLIQSLEKDQKKRSLQYLYIVTLRILSKRWERLIPLKNTAFYNWTCFIHWRKKIRRTSPWNM